MKFSDLSLSSKLRALTDPDKFWAKPRTPRQTTQIHRQLSVDPDPRVRLAVVRVTDDATAVRNAAELAYQRVRRIRFIDPSETATDRDVSFKFEGDDAELMILYIASKDGQPIQFNKQQVTIAKIRLLRKLILERHDSTPAQQLALLESVGEPRALDDPVVAMLHQTQYPEVVRAAIRKGVLSPWIAFERLTIDPSSATSLVESAGAQAEVIQSGESLTKAALRYVKENRSYERGTFGALLNRLVEVGLDRKGGLAPGEISFTDAFLADRLLNEMIDLPDNKSFTKDDKSVRRKVYDVFDNWDSMAGDFRDMDVDYDAAKYWETRFALARGLTQAYGLLGQPEYATRSHQHVSAAWGHIAEEMKTHRSARLGPNHNLSPGDPLGSFVRIADLMAPNTGLGLDEFALTH